MAHPIELHVLEAGVSQWGQIVGIYIPLIGAGWWSLRTAFLRVWKRF